MADRAERNETVNEISKTDEEWRSTLSREAYEVTRKKGTERPFSGKYYLHHEPGVYRCAACGAELFTSDAKFDSGCGWPSFSQPASEAHVKTAVDRSHFMTRVEVLCQRCSSHLGHVFEDGPQPTGLRYCINSVALDFTPAEGSANGKAEPRGKGE